MSSKLTALLFTLPILAAIGLPLIGPGDLAHSAHVAAMLAIATCGFLMLGWIVFESVLGRLARRELPGTLLMALACLVWAYAIGAASPARFLLPSVGVVGSALMVVGIALYLRVRIGGADTGVGTG